MVDRVGGRRRTIGACVALALIVLSVFATRGWAEDAAPATSDWTDASARDPIEGFNRGVFRLNDTLDVYAMEPVARGWSWLAPDPLQQSITNFFRNLCFPVDTINNLLQGKVEGGIVTFGRFVINSTIGFAGIWDPATEWGLEARPEDFGQTLGRWGTPPGPFLMLPLLGPSNIRDTGGLIVDSGLDVQTYFVSQWIRLAGGVVQAVNGRSQFLEEVRDAKAASFDYYVFVRNAYFQRRQALINDVSNASADVLPEDDLYGDTWDDNDE